MRNYKLLTLLACIVQTLGLAASATAWNIETLGNGDYSSLVIDDSGNAHISRQNPRQGSLEYSCWNGSAWEKVTVDSGRVGAYNSLALDAGGRPQISYNDNFNLSLKYAYFNGTAWVKTTVDQGGDVGKFSSLALDADGNPHISYYDYRNGDLKFAERIGSSWSVVTVQSVGDVGQYCSLKLDSSGNPVISYYDATNGDLKLAKRNGSAWTVTSVDTVGDVGQFSSLDINASGAMCISYYDYSNRDLKLASCDGSSWSISTVDSAGDVGQYTSAAIDDNGVVHISYFKYSTGALKYAYLVGGDWVTMVVDGSGNCDHVTSLALNAVGTPAISYYDSEAGTLKYATATSIPFAKQLPGAWTATIDAAVVTAVFDGFFYVEDANRTTGIRVARNAHGMAVGQKVSICGNVATTPGGELEIGATTILGNGSGDVKPLGMTNRSAGGGDAVTSYGAGQQGVNGASGLNNIGLLVKVWGNVTQVDPNGRYFYIDDGSGILDGTKTGDVDNVGVRIASDGRSLTSQMVFVVGVSSCFREEASGPLNRLIRVREIL